MALAIDKGRLDFLKNMTRDVVEACRVRPGETQADREPNTTGRTLIVPSGSAYYPAFWVEDLTLSLDCGFVATDEVKGMFDLILETQNGPETWHLDSGAIVPPFAVANHINFTGDPVFFPGTYSSGPDQGGEPYGNLPDLDDDFYVIEIAHWYYQQAEDFSFLTSEIKGMPVIDRLEGAFKVPPVDDETQLVEVSKEMRGTNFGFMDSVALTGRLLYCSLLRLRAAGHMAFFMDMLGEMQKADHYRRIRSQIQDSIHSVFATESGWLLAATGQCSQHDVWTTARAVYEEILGEQLRQKALDAILDAYKAGTSTCRGNVRHILTTEDWSEDSAWEVGFAELNRYQNGAYWGTSSGWYLYALAQIDEEACARFITEYVDELIENDYRKEGTVGSPLECFHPGENYFQNPIYMTSVTAPLAVLRQLEAT